MMKCPFCGKSKLKLDSKKSSNFEYREGIKMHPHTGAVRCNSCHARGPTVTVYMPSMEYDVEGKIKEKAFELWNTRNTEEEVK